MVEQSDTFNSTDSIGFRETGMLKIGFQESRTQMKKSKLQILVPRNADNIEASESQVNFDDLPDSIVLHILSLMETKEAIQTCVLSKRWRYLWTSIPGLNFNSKSFPQLDDFKRFVLWVLSHRGSSCVKVLTHLSEVMSIDLDLLEKVIEYATLHGVEDIRINYWTKRSSLSLFNCHSLKRVELYGLRSLHRQCVVMPERLNFTTLTTLHLNRLTMCYQGKEVMDPFVNCVNLKNLHLSEMCFLTEFYPRNFVISAPQLNNLTLMCNRFNRKLVVNTPQLINFSYLCSTPGAFLEFNIPSWDGLTIDIYDYEQQVSLGNSGKKIEKTSHGLINMFRGHHDIGVSFRTIADTSVNAAILKPERSYLCNLKSLNFGVGSTLKIFISNFDNLSAYLRRGSQHADFEFVTV